MLTLNCNVKLVSEANQREHWGAKHTRAKKQKNAVGRSLKILMIQNAITDPGKHFSLPIVVKIVRIGKRKLDTDNLAGSAKHVRDAIAKELGIDDGDDRIRWHCAQSIGDYGVRISIC